MATVYMTGTLHDRRAKSLRTTQPQPFLSHEASRNSKQRSPCRKVAKTIREIVRSSLIPFSMPSKHAITPRVTRQTERDLFLSLRSPVVDFREICTEQREPNRLLRMQDPLPSSFSREECRRCCSRECRCRPGAEPSQLAPTLTSPPPRRPSARSASPSGAPPCARGQPWSSHAWRPSPPSAASRGPSRPWRGGSIKDNNVSIQTGTPSHMCVWGSGLGRRRGGIRTCSTRARLCLKVLPLAAWYSSW